MEFYAPTRTQQSTSELNRTPFAPQKTPLRRLITKTIPYSTSSPRAKS